VTILKSSDTLLFPVSAASGNRVSNLVPMPFGNLISSRKMNCENEVLEKDGFLLKAEEWPSHLEIHLETEKHF
jgi:hypothetical protein